MSIPAGWYPDPHPEARSGGLRWWDGDGWTDTTEAAVAGPGTEVPAAAAAQAPVDLVKHSAEPAQTQGYPQQYHHPQQYQDPQQQFAVPQMTHCPDGVALASPWIRLGAYLLDSVLAMVVLGTVSILLFLVLGGGALALLADGAGSGGAVDGARGATGVLLLVVLVLLVLALALGYTYWAFVHRVRTRGASPGKQLLGLRIRSFHADGQLTGGQVWGRVGLPYLASIVTAGLTSIVDVLWLLWDRHVQCLHDKAVGTVVVNTRTPPVPPQHPGVQLAQAFPASRGWVADGPVPPGTATASYRP